MLLMQSVAKELGPLEIRVNSISLGAIKTLINPSARKTPKAEANLLTRIPYDRAGEISDVDKAAVWLA
jgi:glucose 1-dehydrogenase